jgi:predicted transcriptional regulator
MGRSITMDELVQTLESIQSRRPNGSMTSRDIAEELGVCIEMAREKMGNMVRSGRLEYIGKYPTKNMCGHSVAVPHYRIVKLRKKPGK